MTERPILFSGPMVRAILEDRKTQTRRVVKPQPKRTPLWRGCPYGDVGDRLWVRETFARGRGGPIYRADGITLTRPWTPAIHMPRLACRLILEVTAMRVERLQQISEADAKAEGVPGAYPIAAVEYRDLWDSLNAKRGFGWDVNPWVWVIQFQRVE